jgi:uncharacterized membrane protein YbhN (UPF0104 family)
VTDHQRSDRQLISASALIILAGIGLFLTFAQVAAFVVLPSHVITLRVFAAGAFGVALLAACSILLRDTSVLWQIPLQALAASCLAVGVAVIVTAAFGNWHSLLGPTGYRATGCLAVGLGAAWLMRQLQVRLLPQQDA